MQLIAYLWEYILKCVWFKNLKQEIKSQYKKYEYWKKNRILNQRIEDTLKSVDDNHDRNVIKGLLEEKKYHILKDDALGDNISAIDKTLDTFDLVRDIYLNVKTRKLFDTFHSPGPVGIAFLLEKIPSENKDHIQMEVKKHTIECGTMKSNVSLPIDSIGDAGILVGKQEISKVLVKEFASELDTQNLHFIRKIASKNTTDLNQDLASKTLEDKLKFLKSKIGEVFNELSTEMSISAERYMIVSPACASVLGLIQNMDTSSNIERCSYDSLSTFYKALKIDDIDVYVDIFHVDYPFSIVLGFKPNDDKSRALSIPVVFAPYDFIIPLRPIVDANSFEKVYQFKHRLALKTKGVNDEYAEKCYRTLTFDSML